ncbi:MAG: VCBS domain-containing protein [Hyphomicrobiaceae bacterium]
MATYTVTTTNDVVDANDGLLSLREAVAAANASTDADIINFSTSLLPPGFVAGDQVTVAISSVLELTGNSGALTINGDINGDGIGDVAIDGQNTARHFNVDGGATVTLSNLTLKNGHDAGAAGTFRDVPPSESIIYTFATTPGGDATASIYNSGSLVLSNVVLEDNTSNGGAGWVGDNGAWTGVIYDGTNGGNAGIVTNAGTLVTSDVLFANNTATQGTSGLNAPAAIGALINNGGSASGSIEIYNETAGAFANTGSGSGNVTSSLRTVEFAATTYSTNEGNGGTTTITVTLTRPDAFDYEGSVTVAYLPMGADPNHTTTTNGADFASGDIPADQIVTFAAGQQTATVTFEINGDYDFEPTEQFTIYLKDAAGQQITADGVHNYEVITLVNDDTQFSIAQLASSAFEGTPLTFTVTRSGPTDAEQTVSYAVTGSGQFPTNNIDFDGSVLPSGSVTFAAGETTQTITIPVHQDQTVENDETFTVTISSASDHGQIGTATAIGTVLNDDAMYFASAQVASQYEGNSGTTAYEIQLIRSGYTANAVTVDWTAVAGTADASDFPGGVLPSGTVSFDAGQSIATVQVLIAGDETPESNETFTVAFSIAGSPVASPVTLTILDDDQITGTATGSVGEDATLTAGGTLTGEPSHAGATPFQAATGLTGTYGTFTFDESTGAWGYTLNNAAANVQALNGGQIVTDTLTVTTFDGEVSEPVTVTITGANDAATISGTASGAVAENGTLTIGGTLTVTDPDAGQAKFANPPNLAGTYGAFAFNTTTGVWSYALNNSAANVQALTAGQVVTDTITVKSFDGTASQALTATITGANDLATISGTATGSVAEDGALVTGGKLTITDADAGQNVFAAPASLTGTYGTFSFNVTSGLWSYTLANSAANVQALTAGQVAHDTLVVSSIDGTAHQALAVAILGVNEVATITGTSTGSVTEEGTLTTSGTLTVTDPDAGQSRFATPGNLTGTYGAFEFNATTGAWGYTLNNAATNVQGLANGQVVHDTLVVSSLDGSASRTLDVSITGVDDAPTAVTLTPVLQSIAENTAIATPLKIADIAVTDPDGGTSTLALTGTDAASFTIIGSALYLNTGVSLDFETKASYQVAVTADNGVAPSPDATSATYTLNVTNVSPETLTGTDAADVLTGGTDIDLIFGLAGNDTLDSGVDTLADQLIGGNGNDTYLVRSANDIVIENFAAVNATTNVDTVKAAISYGLSANANVEVLTTISASATTAINLTGNGLSQQITGNAGNNVIVGAGGRDILTGGLGADVFKFASIADTGKTAATRDLITDFTHSSTLALSDRIDLSAIDANGALAGNAVFTFLSTRGAQFTGKAGQLHYFASGSSTIIEGDINGDKVADFQIQLSGLKTLSASDFLL